MISLASLCGSFDLYHMRPKHSAESNALIALATRSKVPASGDTDDFGHPSMPHQSSPPRYHCPEIKADDDVDVDDGEDDGDDDEDAHSSGDQLNGLPDVVLRRICFFLDVPSARNLAVTCRGLRAFAEQRVWESVDIFRLSK